MTNAVSDRPTRSFPRALGSRRASAVAPAPVPSQRKSRLCSPWAIIHSRLGRPLALSAAPRASTERRADPNTPSFPTQQLHPRGQGARLQVRRRPPRHGAVRARPDPPPRLSRHRRRTLIAAREIKSPISPPSPPACGRLADDTPPPHTQRTTAPPSSSPAPAARPPPPPPRSPSRSSRRLAPRLPRLPSPASPSPSSASPSASCCCAWRPPSRARSKRFPSLATPRVPDRRTRVIVKCRKRIVSSGSRWRRVIISKLRARVPRNVFGAH